jgi:large subunit ribosomal protein L13
MKTYAPKPRDIERRWYVIDASGAVLGRLATEVASILRGKHKPIFAPHMDTGDHVIVVNAAGVRLTGGKETKKVAYRHSGYPGGLTETSYERLLRDKPHHAVEKAVRGMLPKNRLGRAMARKLQVYPGPEHPHQAQQPQPIALGQVPRWEGLPAPRAAKAGDGGKRSRPAAKPSTTAAAAESAAAEPSASTSKRSTSKTSTAKTSTAKTSTAKTSTAKRSTAKTSTARRSTTAERTSTAKRSTAATSTSKSTAKRTTARRTKKKED